MLIKIYNKKAKTFTNKRYKKKDFIIYLFRNISNLFLNWFKVELLTTCSGNLFH